MRVLQEAPKGTSEVPLDAPKGGDFLLIIVCVNGFPKYVMPTLLTIHTHLFFNSSQGCHWILVKHDKVTTEDEPWEKIVNRKIREGILTLKFEPFILHVQCRGEIKCYIFPKILVKTLMPCPFTGPKMFCASLNILGQIKN